MNSLIVPQRLHSFQAYTFSSLGRPPKLVSLSKPDRFTVTQVVCGIISCLILLWPQQRIPDISSVISEVICSFDLLLGPNCHFFNRYWALTNLEHQPFLDFLESLFWAIFMGFLIQVTYVCPIVSNFIQNRTFHLKCFHFLPIEMKFSAKAILSCQPISNEIIQQLNQQLLFLLSKCSRICISTHLTFFPFLTLFWFFHNFNIKIYLLDFSLFRSKLDRDPKQNAKSFS